MAERYWCAYDQLEEYHAGMWRVVSGEAQALPLIAEAVRLFRDEAGFERACFAVVKAWPVSCRAAMTNPSLNQIAWMGQAACCYAAGVPEAMTRRAWWKLTEEQRAACDAIAARAIASWRQRACLIGLPLFERLAA